MFPSTLKNGEPLAFHLLQRTLERIVQPVSPNPSVIIDCVDIDRKKDRRSAYVGRSSTITFSGIVYFNKVKARFKAPFYATGLSPADQNGWYAFSPPELTVLSGPGGFFTRRVTSRIVVQLIDGIWQFDKFEDDQPFLNSLHTQLGR